MSVRTNIRFLNGNHPDFIAAINGTAEEKEEFESSWGDIEDNPGMTIEDTDDLVVETEEEYGGWIIAVKDIPKDATHIKINRY